MGNLLRGGFVYLCNEITLRYLINRACLVLTGRCSHFVSMPEHEWLLR